MDASSNRSGRELCIRSWLNAAFLALDLQLSSRYRQAYEALESLLPSLSSAGFLLLNGNLRINIAIVTRPIISPSFVTTGKRLNPFSFIISKASIIGEPASITVTGELIIRLRVILNGPLF